MKVLFLGDLHLGARNGNIIILNMMDSFFKNELFPFILKNKIETVIQLGDILDKRKNIEFPISNYLLNTFFRFFEDNKINFISTIGNHDLYYRQNLDLDGPSQFADNFKYVEIVKTPRKYMNIHLIPWICDANKDSVIEYIDLYQNTSDIICGHFELAGFPIHKNFLSTKGTVGEESLHGYKAVLSGHYHSPSAKGNIEYIGTPYQITWNDYGDIKKFLVYDTETNEFEVVKTNTKLFFKIYYSDDIQIDYSQYRKSYIKVILTSDYNAKKFEKFLDKLNKETDALSIQVIDNRNVHVQDSDDISAVEIDDPFHIMINYIDNDLEDKELAITVKELVSEIYQKAQEDYQ